LVGQSPQPDQPGAPNYPLLDHPNVQELAESLNFSPTDGRIWLHQQRMILLHSNTFGLLLRELIGSLGLSAARNMLTRLGYAAGVRDAEAVRAFWPDDSAGAFTAGMRLHALEGMVKCTTLSAEFDISRGLFHGEYLWHDSVEASEYVAAYGIGNEPACYMQIGYASGYASFTLGRQVIYREVECMAMGAAHCRVVGKHADAWENSKEDLRYLTPPVVRRSSASAAVANPLSNGVADSPAPVSREMIGISAAFHGAYKLLERVAPTRATVLFVGESGVGKELFARALHQASPRAGKPFVAVNCAAIPDALFESELFGVDKGAFTGANTSRPGRFERASGGTLFLDELPSLSLTAQGKLLRALQEHEVDRVGGSRSIAVDVRVVAATNRDLLEEVRAGRVREDLYYRLNVFPIHLPPLRERRDDLPLLIDHFLAVYNRAYDKKVSGFAQRAVTALLNHEYPGNIRELQNIVERGVISAGDDGIIELHHIFPNNEARRTSVFSIGSNGELNDRSHGGEPNLVAKLLDQKDFSLTELENQMYQSALSASGGNIAAAARRLGVTRAQLAYRLKSR
jgi:DNA-binding NtrC family response regulator/predicted hydrocarbon binding protein